VGGESGRAALLPEWAFDLRGGVKGGTAAPLGRGPAGVKGDWHHHIAFLCREG